MIAGLAVIIGVVAGLSSAALLVSLEWATDERLRRPWLLWLLPVAGFGIGHLYHYSAGRAVEGNNLIIDEIHEPDAGVPRRMAPLIFLSTLTTQLFGGSAGREGTGIQLSVGLSDSLLRPFTLDRELRRLLLITGLAAGFGAMFGVPVAGAIFGLEVLHRGRLRYDALVPALVASFVGDRVVRVLGVDHLDVVRVGPVDLSTSDLVKLALAGAVFGLVAMVFVRSVHHVQALSARVIGWPPLRPLIGGVLIIGLTLLVADRDYLGLSLPLASSALAGEETAPWVFALKLLFTVVTLGFGFYGGEVTPLMVIGATLGAALAPVLGLPVSLLAACGYVAVLAGAANIPLAGTIMAAEIFGGSIVAPAAIACVVSFVVSSRHSIYRAQRQDPI